MEHTDDNQETKTKYFSTTEYSGGEMFGYNDPKPAEPRAPSKRPLLISIICVLGFIAGAAGLLVSFFADMPPGIDWYRPFLVLGVLVSVSGYVGIWKMKIWGLYILSIMFVVSMVVGYATGTYSIVNMGGSALILFICVLYSGRMD